MSTQALIALGSNLGDREAHLGAAVAALGRAGGIVLSAVSSYHETPPVGGPGGQGAFLNAAVLVETSLHPLALLHRLQDVEQQAGRVRAERWGERPLDLDLILFGDRRLHLGNRTPLGPELRVPHPRFALRRFVLAPLAEVAPRATDPVTGRTVADLLANLDRRPSSLAFHDPPGRFPPALLERVVARLEALAPALDPHGLAAAQRAGDDRWHVHDAWPRDRDPASPGLSPTFVVVARPSPAESSHAPAPAPIAGKPSPPPVLEVDADDVDAALADVLAACAATRAGF